MLEHPHTGTAKRRMRLLISLMSSVALLAGCANLEGSRSAPDMGRETASGSDGSSSNSGNSSSPSELASNYDWNQLIDVAATTVEKGELGTAAMLYKEAHLQRPSEPEPLRRLGPILLQLGHPLEASEAYKSLLAIDQNDNRARIGLGRSLIALNRPYAASLQFTRLIEQQHDNVQAIIGLGVSYDLMGDNDRAQEAFRTGLAYDPSNTSLLNNLGHSLTRAGRFDEAIQVLQIAVDLPGTTTRHRHNLALAYGLAGKLREAAEMMSYDLDTPSMQQNMAYFRAQAGLQQLGLARPVPRVAPAAPTPPAPPTANLAEQPKASSEPAQAAKRGPTQLTPSAAQPQQQAKAPEAPKTNNDAPKASSAKSAAAPSAAAQPAKSAQSKPAIGATPHARAAALSDYHFDEEPEIPATAGQATAAIAPPLPDGEEAVDDKATGTPGGGKKKGVEKTSQKEPLPAQPANDKNAEQETMLRDGNASADPEITLLAELNYHASPLPGVSAQQDAGVQAENPPVALFQAIAR